MSDTEKKPWVEELEGLEREEAPEIPDWEPKPHRLSPGPMWGIT